MKLAAIYLRVSTEEQNTENQREELVRMVRARGFEIGTVQEEKASAAGARPVLEAMLRDLRRGNFRALFVWALDRLGRSMVGNVNLVLELDRLGVQVVSAREPWLDAHGPVRELLVAIFGWIAEQERRRLGERTRAGLERARREGARIGRPRRLAPVDARKVRILVANGLSVRAIAQRLRVPRATVHRFMVQLAQQLL